MNNKAVFPDDTIDRYIQSLAKEFDMEFVSLTSEQKKFEMTDGTYENWVYIFRKQGSLTSLKITFTSPQGFIGVTFKSDAEKKQSVPNYFLFEAYLKQILKAHDELNKLDEISRNKSWKEDWRLPLDILKRHLRTDLKDVIDGKVWPTVYFDWADYVEPEAMDRIYEDQTKLIEQKSKTGKGWLSFLKPKKKE